VPCPVPPEVLGVPVFIPVPVFVLDIVFVPVAVFVADIVFVPVAVFVPDIVFVPVTVFMPVPVFVPVVFSVDPTFVFVSFAPMASLP